MENSIEFLKSREVQMELRISSCDLAHLRLEGKLRFLKKGNAFYYFRDDVEICKGAKFSREESTKWKK